MNNNNVFSKKSIKNKTLMEETPYWENTNELVGGLVEEEDEDAKDEKGKPLQGLALLKRIYGSSTQEPKGGKRTAKEIKKFIEASYNEKNPPKEIEGFLLDTELSNKTAKVYHNPTTNETVIAHRGTSGLTDWANNLAYVTGNYEKTDRYKKGKKNQKKAEAKYGAENISTLGHSQGAIIARKTGANTKEIIGVNPASMGEKPLANEYNVRTSGDLVSKMLPSGKNVTTIKSKTSNPLTEHSAKNLKQIKNQEIGAGIKISYNDMDNQCKGGRRRALNYSANDIDWVNDGLLDDDDEMVGGDIFKSISKGAKSLGKKISKGSKSLGKDIGSVAKKGYQTINKTALKQDWGGAIETVKEPLLEVLEPVMSATMESVGVPAPVADTISASAVGSAKAVDFSKSLKGQGQKALTGAIHGAITGAVGSMTGGDPEEGAGFRRRKIRGGARPSNITDAMEGRLYLSKGKWFVVIRGGNDEFVGFENGSTVGRQFSKKQALQRQKEKYWLPHGETIAQPLNPMYNDAFELNQIEYEIEKDIENGKYPNPKLHPKYERGQELHTLFQKAIKEKEGEARRKMLEELDADEEDEGVQVRNDGFNEYDVDEREEDEEDEEETKKELENLKKLTLGKGRAGVRYTKKGVPVSRAYQIVSAIEAKSVKSAKKLIDLQKMKNPSKYLIKKYGHVELEEAHPSSEVKPKMVIAKKVKTPAKKYSASATKVFDIQDLTRYINSFNNITKEQIDTSIEDTRDYISNIGDLLSWIDMAINDTSKQKQSQAGFKKLKETYDRAGEDILYPIKDILETTLIDLSKAIGYKDANVEERLYSDGNITDGYYPEQLGIDSERGITKAKTTIEFIEDLENSMVINYFRIMNDLNFPPVKSLDILLKKNPTLSVNGLTKYAKEAEERLGIKPSAIAKSKLGKGRASQIVSVMEAKKLINLQKMKNPSQWLKDKYGKKKYVRPQRGVKGARGKRGVQKTAKMTVEEQQASRKATLAKARAKTISLSSEIRDVVKAIPTMNYLELMELKPTLIRFNNAERTKAEDNNLEKLKTAFNKRSEELKESNKGRTQGMALARARDISDTDDVIEGFGRKGKGLTNKIVKHLDKDNKEMIKLHKAFQKHMDTEEATK